MQNQWWNFTYWKEVFEILHRRSEEDLATGVSEFGPGGSKGKPDGLRIYKDGKETRKCYFQSEDHRKKHVERYKLKKKDIQVLE